ncbi:Glutamate--tRNA ligase [Sporomusa ovata DSM 2662]|uniref:Glutamate--tRNA ligase n=1 Tax=Sporomusa ovata TaxID=2378 RepID=A0A0U1KW66_9FIRM|nr:glutamate--tRNA ligase [Sporomusa ovata]EQB28041.1 glutamate--tRNA ligase [Sporomusa ovata DSM 2662]CQR71576.1 Glutamyl-tRNA synthetase @ Glutamyl-tRNA(Gln) synthetase [Sporomusa ovata]
MEQELRVRFAPSPTGPFHIGGARSALFNWLLARKEGGKLILRIEDTDLERSTRESEENIKASLRWLGIEWDEGIDIGGEYGPYRQTERLDIYRQYTQKLLASGQAYYCYCSEEELDAERQRQLDKGENPHYTGRCRDLSPVERERFIAEGRKPTVRFRVPENQQIVFKDMVRDTVSFESNGVGDFVIVKSDGIPVYNYAVVLDDALMKITHVIRAEEHLSNTPRQILLYQALGLPLPQFGHISLILGKDRTKMSKRHGATSVEQYRNLGYLPEGIVNFLALLGWAPAGEEEIFNQEELIQAFSMDRVAKNPAVFDVDKLNYINAHYIKQASPELITELALPHLQAAGFIGEELTAQQREWLVKVVAELQGYISYAAQITEHIGVFFNDDINFENEEAHEIMKDADIPKVLEAFKTKLTALDQVEPAAVQAILKGITKELKLGGKKVYMPVRIAITGKMHGLELINLIPLIGKERTLARMDCLIAKI